MTKPTCERCARPVADMAYVCAACAARLARDLTAAADLTPELTVTVARLDRIGQGGRGNGDNPLVVNLDASANASAVVNTLTTWARHVSEERGQAIPLPRTTPCLHHTCTAVRRRGVIGPVCALNLPPERQSKVMVAWLAGQVEWLRHRKEAMEAYDELDHACALLRRTVDIPVPRWYAGPCVCGTDLYAATLAATVRCQDCAATYDAQERKAWLLEQAQDVLAHAGWIASAASALGEPVTADMIYGYVRRGRLLAHGRDVLGRPVYRVGDVLDILARVAA